MILEIAVEITSSIPQTLSILSLSGAFLSASIPALHRTRVFTFGDSIRCDKALLRAYISDIIIIHCEAIFVERTRSFSLLSASI